MTGPVTVLLHDGRTTTGRATHTDPADGRSYVLLNRGDGGCQSGWFTPDRLQPAQEDAA